MQGLPDLLFLAPRLTHVTGFATEAKFLILARFLLGLFSGAYLYSSVPVTHY
jgi:hypothetical protein